MKVKNRIQIEHSITETGCVIKICNINKPFAFLTKQHDSDEWWLHATTIYPLYLGLKPQPQSKKFHFTLNRMELLKEISLMRDEAMAKYISEIKMYHTRKLNNQIDRYEKFSGSEKIHDDSEIKKFPCV